MKKSALSSVVGVAILAMTQSAWAVYPTGSGTNYVTTIDSATYRATGTITFNDWGYTGPNGSGVNDFVVPGSGGFDAGNIGQIQTVVTFGASSTGTTNIDWQTPDAGRTVRSDDLATPYPNANMDGQVNFYAMAYTTPANSTFNNMQIDKAGNYFVARENMAFGFYDYFLYKDKTGTNPDALYDTNINFQPYAVSDAMGWCGSVLNTNPNGVDMMAGQVTFDFAFDAYFVDGAIDPVRGGNTQIVPGFVMRSYGDYTFNVIVDGETIVRNYTGNAVMNNTNPITGELDPAYQNLVSFLGGGVVPRGVWVTADSFNPDGSRRLNADGTWALNVDYDLDGSPATPTCDPNVQLTPRSDGAVCYRNSFAGYPFLMRADGSRQLTFINPTGHSNYVATDPAAYASVVPAPAAAWLFGSGLVGLAGLMRKKVRA